MDRGIAKIVCLIWVSAVLGSAPAKAQSEAADSLRLYEAALAETNPDSRLEQLSLLVKKYPMFKEAQYALAAEYYRRKQYEQAIPPFQAVIRLDADFARNVSAHKYLLNAYLQWAVQLIAAGLPEKAVEVLKEAEQIDSNHALLQYHLGNAYYQLNRFEEAIAAYQKAIAAGVMDADIKSVLWFNLAGAYYALENFAAAAQAYERALQWNPDLAEAETNLQKARLKVQLQSRLLQADSALAANNPRLARRLAGAILAQDSSFVQAQSIYAEANRRILYDQALSAVDARQWRQALNRLQQLPEGYLDVSELIQMVRRQMQLQRQREIQKELDRVLELMASGSITQAQTLLEKLAQELPDDPRVTAYQAHLDSLQAASRAPSGAASNPAGTGMEETDEPTFADKSPVVSSRTFESGTPRNGARLGSSAMPLRVFKQPLIWLVLGSLILAFVGYVVFRQRQRLVRRKEMDAALFQSGVGKQAGSETAANTTAPASGASGPKEDTEAVEKEMLDLVAGGEALDEAQDAVKEKAESERVDQPEMAEVSESDFLAILQDEEMPGTWLQEETETGEMAPAGDVTRTVDMSQFRIRKIGRYVLEKEIGRGAAGRIYKAWDPKLDRTVVIKTVSYSLTASEDEISRLKARVYREAKTAAKLNHPHIVVVYDVEDEKHFSYIVMEYVEGPNLRELLNQEHRLEPGRAIRLVKQVCQALEFAHESGVVHRDIKPSNILIVDEDKVKVTDFGIAKVINHLTLTQTGRVVGTPGYMAPEQIEGGRVDSRSDIFSLGVVFYELITGKRPFEGESLASLAYKIVHVDPVPPSLVNVELSEVYDEIINRAMAKDPQHRFQSAAEFYQALSKIEAAITS